MDLCQALQPDSAILIISLKYPGVPAFYDIKDMGVLRAMTSLYDACHAFGLQKGKADVLIFDEVTWLEKCLASGAKTMALINHDSNIYRNYRSTFLQLFGRVKDEVVQPGIGKTSLIMPKGRKSFRNIPSELIDRMADCCLAHVFEPVMYMLEGEASITCRVPRVIHAKRSFAHLRRTIG